MKNIKSFVFGIFSFAIFSSAALAQSVPPGPLGNVVNKDTTSYRSNGVLNTAPNGTYRAATGTSTILNSATLLPQVNGFTAPNQLYIYNDVGSVADFSANYGSFVDDFHPNPSVSSWTSTTATLSTPLTSTQVSNIQAMIAQQAYLLNPVGPMALSSDSLLGNITSVTTTTVTVGNWMAVGNSASGQVPTGSTLQINPQAHIWAQNSNVYLQAGTMTSRATIFEGDLLNNKGPSGANANVSGVTMNCHDTGNTYGCNSGYIASGTDANPFSTGFVSSKNKIGYQSTGDTVQGFVIQHATNDPPFGFVSFQNGGNPFAYNPANTGYAWSVGSNGGMSVGNSSLNNGMSISVVSSGSSPTIQAVGVDTNIALTLRGKGTGAVTTIGNLSVGGTATATGYIAGSSTGVSCAAGTVSVLTIVVTNGIVTHC